MDGCLIPASRILPTRSIVHIATILSTGKRPPLTPPALLAAHRANDRAVLAAYNFPSTITESDCVAELFKLYEALAGEQGGTGAAGKDADGGGKHG